MLMRLTLSVIKADVGSVGGHTKPSARMMATVEGEVAKAICDGLLIDGFVCHTGDDIAIIMTHTRGEGSSEVHQLAWKAFLAATSVAKTSGLYGAGQDLLVDAPSGNVRGAGPGVAELSFDHSLSGTRPAESFMVFAADKSRPRRLQPAALPRLRRSHVLRRADASPDDQGFPFPCHRHGPHGWRQRDRTRSARGRLPHCRAAPRQ